MNRILPTIAILIAIALAVPAIRHWRERPPVPPPPPQPLRAAWIGSMLMIAAIGTIQVMVLLSQPCLVRTAGTRLARACVIVQDTTDEAAATAAEGVRRQPPQSTVSHDTEGTRLRIVLTR